MSFKEKIEWLDDSYGVIAKWVWRIIFYPICVIVFYSATSYLNNHYVSKIEYENDRAASETELKQNFSELKMGLNQLLLQNASGTEKLIDFEHRITRLENQADEETKRNNGGNGGK